MARQTAKRSVTLRMVADEASVSPITVSYVLRGMASGQRISEDTARRVTAIAQRLGYRGNYHAASLVSGRALTIGLPLEGAFCPLAVPFWSSMIAGIEHMARARGYNLLIVGGTEGRSALEHAEGFLTTRRIDAVVLFGRLYDTLAPAWRRAGIPVVLIDAQGQPGVTQVNLDPVPGMEAAGHRLADLGHREIMWLGDRPGVRTFAQRLAALGKVATVRGLRITESYLRLPPSPGAEDAQARMTQELLRRLQIPAACTAVVCQNDEWALSLYRVMWERGRQVPKELSVIGHDDIAAAAVAAPGLSTVSHRLLDLGAAAVALAIDIVEGRIKAGTGSRTLPSQLIERESIGAAPSSL